METFGRERRHRYYTVAAFRAAGGQEGLDISTTGYADIDFSAVGGFAPMQPNLFYEKEEALLAFADSYKDRQLPEGGKKNKKPKRGRKNPVLPDGTIKLGRPRKTSAGSKRKRKPEDGGDGDTLEAGALFMVPDKDRRRKKPRLGPDSQHALTTAGNLTPGPLSKNIVKVVLSPKRVRPLGKKASDIQLEASDGPALILGKDSVKPAAPKKRGRPPKVRQAATDPERLDSAVARDSETEEAPPKKRGRVSARASTHPSSRESPKKETLLIKQTSAESTVACKTSSCDPASTDNAEVYPTSFVATSLPQPEELRRSPRKRQSFTQHDTSLAVIPRPTSAQNKTIQPNLNLHNITRDTQATAHAVHMPLSEPVLGPIPVHPHSTSITIDPSLISTSGTHLIMPETTVCAVYVRSIMY